MYKYLIGLIAVGVAASAQADIAFSNFGPGDSYYGSAGYAIYGSAVSSGYRSLAQQFVSQETGELTRVRVPMFLVSGTNSVKVTLFGNSNLNTFGTTLETWTLNGAIHNYIVDFDNAVPGLQLVTGNTYWLLVTPGANDMQGGWYNAEPGEDANRYGARSFDGTNYDYANYEFPAAFSVEVAPVPEPASLAAIGLGVAIVTRRRKLKARS